MSNEAKQARIDPKLDTVLVRVSSELGAEASGPAVDNARLAFAVLRLAVAGLSPEVQRSIANTLALGRDS